jgi:hypothetical protein
MLILVRYFHILHAMPQYFSTGIKNPLLKKLLHIEDSF